MLPNNIIHKIKELTKTKKGPVIIAIDGRCGGGKTTLAAELSKELDCNIIHMDDFFLRPEQRTAERLNTPGGNIDHERFFHEVLLPLKENKPFSYRPYSCSKQALVGKVEVEPCAVTIVEGTYSCHNALRDLYDLSIFVDIDPKTQMERIIRRNGEEWAKDFKNKWIPLEEKYFAAYDVQNCCDIQICCER